MALYTIGHSTRPIVDFVALLRENGIALLADVRAYPRSRRNPQFDAERLRAALAEAGIAYRHLPGLGGRRKPEPSIDPALTAAWREEAFRNYAAYALTPPFRAALSELRALAADRACAVMCAEADWRQCHRRIVTDHLLAAGEAVTHIIGPGRCEPATLTPSAERRSDGGIAYPAAQGRLL